MEDSIILDKIRDILEEWFEVAPSIITPEAALRNDLELDSLDIVDFVVVLEKQFGFKIIRAEDEPAMRQFKTVSDVIAFIQKKISSSPASPE